MHPRLMFWSNYEYTDLYSTVVEFQKSDANFLSFPKTCQAF